MATSFDRRLAAFSASDAVLALLRKAGAMIATAARFYSGRRQIALLGQLSDHMLKDIGLDRSDLRDAAAIGYPADPTRFLVIRAVERRAARTLARRRNAQLAADDHREAA